MLRHNLIDDLKDQVQRVLMAFIFRIFTLREVPNTLIFVDFLDETQESKEDMVVKGIFGNHGVVLVLIKIKNAFEKVTNLNFDALVC
tara:strand:- start:1589 stop:1849 length:261 start_codon:yes stop_codon:yes gene_type:complete